MNINRSIDFEYEIKQVLEPTLIAYVRPLPENPTFPNILITQVGGTESNLIDSVDIVLDSRGTSDYDAMITLNNAIGILRKAAKEQTSAIRYMEVLSSGSWGSDPVRPDLKMRSARIRVIAHLENVSI